MRVPNCRKIKSNRKMKIREDNLNLSKYLRLSEKLKEFEELVDSNGVDRSHHTNARREAEDDAI